MVVYSLSHFRHLTNLFGNAMKYIRFGITPKVDREAVIRAYEPLHKKINAALDNLIQRKNEYGNAVESIFLVPEIVSSDYVPARGHSVRKFDNEIKAASYRFPIDLQSFLNGDANVRIQLITENIVASIKDLQKSQPVDFDADTLIRDVKHELSKLQS